MPRSRPYPRQHSRRPKLPPELRTVNLNAAGVDVGADQQYVAVPEGRDPDGHTVRSFGAFTADLHALSTWLRECGVETVAIAYASYCTSFGRCERFSVARRLFDNLTPLAFCGG